MMTKRIFSALLAAALSLSLLAGCGLIHQQHLRLHRLQRRRWPAALLHRVL